MIDAANSFGQQQVTLRSLADAFPRARWVRAFNSLSASVMADDNHRKPPWVMFLSGDEEAKPVVAQLIRDAGFDPVRPGWHRRQPAAGPRQRTVDQHPHSRRGDGARRADKVRGTAAADQAALRTRVRELTAPFEKLRDHAPDDPAFFLEHLSRSVFEAGINWRVVEGKWDGIREAFHGFDPAQVAAMPPAEIAAVENDSRVIRNKAKIRATWRTRGKSSPSSTSTAAPRAISRPSRTSGAAAADMRRRFKFLGDTGVWRLSDERGLVTSAGDRAVPGELQGRPARPRSRPAAPPSPGLPRQPGTAEPGPGPAGRRVRRAAGGRLRGSCPEPGGLGGQVLLLRQARWCGGRGAVVGDRGLRRRRPSRSRWARTASSR